MDWFLVALRDEHCRHSSIQSEDSKVDPFEISNVYSYRPRHRHHWSFGFAHASTSSKCILFSIRCLFQLNYFVEWPSQAECIVSEMIDWLKVSDPALIKEIFWSPDNWEEPNSGSSTTGSADRVDGRCTQESRRGDSDSEAEWYWWRAATICRVGRCDPKGSDCTTCVIVGRRS